MTPKRMNARIEAHLLVAGALCFVLVIAELWHRRWLAALLSAAMTTALFALAVTSMRRKDHHRKGRR